MKSREISRSKIGPFSLACTDPYIGIGWEYQSNPHDNKNQCIILRLQLSFVTINVQLMLV